MRVLTWLLVVLVGTPLLSLAEEMDHPHYRFWRGYKRDFEVKVKEENGKVVRDKNGLRVWETDKRNPMTWDEFKSLINNVLIPATPSCCSEPSLIAYLPALTRLGEKPNFIPDEIAVIVYKSKKIYEEARPNKLNADKSNIEGVTYGPLHSDVFNRENRYSKVKALREKFSRTLVPHRYEGKIDLTPKNEKLPMYEASYDVLQSKTNWQAGNIVVRIHKRNLKQSLENYVAEVTRYVDALKASNANIGLDGYLILVSDYYFIEYQNWKKAENFASFKKSKVESDFITLMGTPFTEQHAAPKQRDITALKSLRYETVDWDSAGTIQFKPGEKTPVRVKHHRFD